LVPEHHAFAKARGAENVARVIARDAGDLELRGAGAGGAATASAVLGDIVSALRAISERHDFSRGGRVRALESAAEVAPLFGLLAHHQELPAFPLWDDEQLYADPRNRVAALVIPSLVPHHGRPPGKLVQGGCPQV
jgi:Homoserine dehydrogenase